jgi:DNA repair protein RadA/Sms
MYGKIKKPKKDLRMANNTIFICSHCDAQYTKWVGRCLECGKWSTIEAEAKNKKPNIKKATAAPAAKTVGLHDISKTNMPRSKTNINELDRVLGGGIVPGSLILLGGEPGIGKSTLSLQIAMAVTKTLYTSGEESVQQIHMRAERLNIKNPELRLLNETHVESIIATILKEKPTLAIVDSIQTLYSDEVDGGPGAVNQVRACTTKLLACAKSANTSIILIGHVTKDGAVAGPRTLEHLVDTVLYLEGDRYQNLRMLRTMKNRFGSTDEIGMFEMLESGLSEVANPSELLLAERGDSMPGSVVTCLMEGTRPLLVEVQALVSKTSFGFPVRKASGFDLNRLHVLIAVLERRAGVPLGQYDVHVNIVGGVKAKEPAIDLAVCLAIASAFKDKVLGNDLAVFGEVGLGGEIRSVRFLERRLKECGNMGMKRVITKAVDKKAVKNLNIISVKNIQELIKHT